MSVRFVRLAFAGVAAALLAPGATCAVPPRNVASGHLTAFASAAELRAFLRRLHAAAPVPPPAPVMAAPVATTSAPPAKVEGYTGDMINSLPQAFASITNNQEANVDEGDIVKLRGDILVILRRGRLFTVSIAGGRIRPVDSINAFPPGVTGEGDWYDEMLVDGDRVIVVGYSYERGGTEINRFRLDSAGRLSFEDASHLKSNDYYSSRNYASRLIGNRLIFYAPLYLDWDKDPLEALPSLGRWRRGAKQVFRPIATARQIYIPGSFRRTRDVEIDTLHSVTSCDVTAPELSCTAIGVLGPEARTFYVAADSVYLWLTDFWDNPRKGQADGFAVRMPFSPEAPSATAVRGAPVDQFSFRSDASEGILNVLVRGEGGPGDWMFGPERSRGGVALVRARLADFGDGSRELPRDRYRPLPHSTGDSSFENRFAGPYVVYGGGAFGERSRDSALFVAPLHGGPVARLRVPHAVERIDLMGRDAVVIGSAPEGLGFTSVELASGGPPRLGDHYLHPRSAQGESRSHAFFFRPDPSTPDGASGTIGLPVARPADRAYQRFFGSSVAMLFLHRNDRLFSAGGALAAQDANATDDGCTASCVDWYGNARPIFVGDRVFALMGYELVEGRLGRTGPIREVARVSFAPRSRPPLP